MDILLEKGAFDAIESYYGNFDNLLNVAVGKYLDEFVSKVNFESLIKNLAPNVKDMLMKWRETK